jgi:hypothetical protein
MKRILAIVALAVACTVVVSAGAFLDYFTGKSDGTNVILDWKTGTESGLVTFEIQRKAGYTGDFVTIGSSDPRGSNSSYEYVDRSAYKQTGNVYTYRLRIVEQGGLTSFSNEVSVSHSVSSVKRTWGSIKAMFR